MSPDFALTLQISALTPPVVGRRFGMLWSLGTLRYYSGTYRRRSLAAQRHDLAPGEVEKKT